MSERIRILLADDHTIFRQGLKRLLQDDANIEVVGEADDGQAAVRLAAELSPDVIVMDVNMPDLNGIESTRQIKFGQINGDRPKIIALSAKADRHSTSQMLKAGAMAYVVKESAFNDLVAAVHSVLANKLYLSPDVTGTVVEDFVHGGDSASSKLSPREREVVQLIAEGKATKEVAILLHLSVKTVETHRRNIMDKLEMFSVAELTKFAIQEGITTLNF